MICCRLFCLSVKAEYAEHGAKDLTVIYNDRIHGIILRLETDMSLLLVECLDRSGIIDQSYHNLSVMCCVLGMYENTVSVKIPALIMDSPRTFRMKDSPLGTTSAGTGK